MAQRNRYNSGSGDIVRWFRARVTNLESGAVDAVEKAAEEGAEMAREVILSSGTARSGKEGRVDTWRMFDAIESQVTLSDRGRVTGRFGWLRDRADYFTLQEGGFNHTSGVNVPGMEAIKQAQEHSQEVFEAELRKAMRNA